jgi:hypothetical protein
LLIWVKLEREYFCEWGWTEQIILIRFDNSRCKSRARNSASAIRHRIPPHVRADRERRLVGRHGGRPEAIFVGQSGTTPGP